MKERQDLGLTFLKMDFGVDMLKNHPHTVIGGLNMEYDKQWGDRKPLKGNARSYAQTKHPFTGIQVTDEGIDIMSNFVNEVRKAVGYDIPLAADHFGHFGVNTAIRIGKALEKYQLAWLEDMIPWFYTDQWKQISDALDTPTLTGEDIYLKEEFIKLIDARAVDMIQPDLASSGGLLETKKSVIMPKNMVFRWQCILPALRLVLWLIFIVLQPLRTLLLWSTTLLMFPGGKIWLMASISQFIKMVS